MSGVVKVDETPEAQGPSASFRAQGERNTLAFQYIDKSKPVPHLSWKDVSFSVAGGKGRKEILQGITGQLKPGELTCILGPSGSGKTSLLNILAGRVRPGGKSSAQFGGGIYVNGMPFEPSRNQHLFGYVMQEDALFATSTPREIFEFSAGLRLGISDQASLKSVLDDMVKSMGLEACADSMVGDELIKGISGGEKKRTAIGQELVTNPQITFLDEPTSGLDSEAAYSVVEVLKELTKVGQSVLCTIHQPSSETFFQFDKAIFLARGKVMYSGPLTSIRQHFGALGSPCPQDYNPADFVLFLTKHADGATMTKLVAGVVADMPEVGAEGKEQALPKAAKTKGFFKELMALSARELKKTVRDKATLGARFGSTIFITVLQSLIFFRIGSQDSSESALVYREEYDLQSHAGATMMLGIGAMFGAAQPLLLTFTAERPVFLRERACNTYTTPPYFLSKTVIEIPLIFLQMLVQWAIAVPMMGLQGSFLLHWLASVLVGLVAASTALLVGCTVKDAKTGMELAPVLFVPQILFGGFFIKMESVPVFMRWLQYVFCLKWGMNIVMIAEFEGTPEGDRLIRMNDAYPEDLPIYFGVLIALFVVFRLLSMLALSRKAKALYN